MREIRVSGKRLPRVTWGDSIQENANRETSRLANLSSGNSILDNLALNSLSSLTNNIPISVKLDGNNYLIWHKQLLCSLMTYRLKGFINGMLPKLA